MKFLFPVGAEGCGHTMTRSILIPIFEKCSGFVDQGDWHDLMMEFWNPAAKLKERLKGRAKIEQKLAMYKQKGSTHLFDSASFPYDHPRNSLRRFDLLEFVDIVKNYAEIRLLVLYRNPISAAYSGYRRGFVKHPFLQAKIVEDNMIFLSSQLSLLPKEIYRIFIFEEFLKNPFEHISPLAAWWGLDEDLLRDGLGYLKKAIKIKQISAKIKHCLEDFFTKDRIKQWELLFAEERRLVV